MSGSAGTYPYLVCAFRRKSCAFGEGQAIEIGAGKSSEGAEMATEDPSNGGSAYPGRE